MVTVFFSYSHKDEHLRNQLEKQLTMLRRQGIISTWHDRRLTAGTDVDTSIDQQIEYADIILLLVSPDFLASDYCYGIEMQRALQRHGAGARIIPVILRPCEWTHAPFGKLLATPKDGEPVTKWTDPDEAFLDIARAIRAAAAESVVSTPPGAALEENRKIKERLVSAEVTYAAEVFRRARDTVSIEANHPSVSCYDGLTG
jgi:hypothetical protein